MSPLPHEAQPLPARPNLENFKKIAKGTVKSGQYPTLAKAQFSLARSYGFESWPKFSRHIQALARISPVSRFEAAVDAIVSGDIAALRKALDADPKLVHARSTRLHAATLLIYSSANGVEPYRQKTPPNIVAIATLLLDAGADVNATANTYSDRCGTLELTATSCHPRDAGVQQALMELLLARGASLDKPTILRACLGNGHPGAAEFLAVRGAHIDLEGAAGLGRLEETRHVYNSATDKQKCHALMWACEYGRNDVVDFLISKGADLASHTPDGQTPLHWAIIGGQIETVKLLLRHNPPLDQKNRYGGTPLGQARWSAGNDKDPAPYLKIIEILKEAESKLGSKPRQ
jgi:hypothetical protein